MADTIVLDEPRGIERLVDRYWFMVRGRGFRLGAPPGEADAAGTLVLRDGECVIVSMEAAALGWPEGTLLFRFQSETTPCAACVDRAIGLARHRVAEAVTPRDVRELLRFAVARCAAAGADAAHGTVREAPSAPRFRGADGALSKGERRYDAELWLVL